MDRRPDAVEDRTGEPPDGAELGSASSFGLVHDTFAGRLLIGFLASLLVVAVVSWNLPAGRVRDDLRDEFRPLVRTLGLDQSWALFSPDPSRTSVDVRAEIHRADGTVVIDRFPGGDPLVGALREYRWRKLERRVRDEDYRRLWEPTATWFAEQHGSAENPVVRVVLIRRLSTTPEPASGDERTWSEEEFYSLDFEAAPIAERSTSGGSPSPATAGEKCNCHIGGLAYRLALFDPLADDSR